MPNYRRLRVPGGIYSFTLCLADRRKDTLVSHIATFRRAYSDMVDRAPIETLAICILPDHLHMMWMLPDGDDDFISRINHLKGSFTRALPDRLKSDGRRGERGIWQPRYWEHHIRNETDFDEHVAYIHFNPVKHGLVREIEDWPFSSWHRDNRRAGLGPPSVCLPGQERRAEARPTGSCSSPEIGEIQQTLGGRS